MTGTSCLGLRLGIIGGGQLARMIAMAASQFGVMVHILERQADAPAVSLAHQFVLGDWDDPSVLLKFAADVDVVTLENEFIDASALAELEHRGHQLYPTAASIALVQDKLIQKESLVKAGLPVVDFYALTTPAEITDLGKKWGWPLFIKARRNGYDGKGNAHVETIQGVHQAWEQLDGTRRALYAEAFCPFVRELAVIVTTARNGDSVTYPLVETVQHNNICHVVRAPADVSAVVEAKALALAQDAVKAVGGYGSFGVEMFLLADETVLLNELAPRVHNSGHYTIEACECSQFENHVRAVLDWPLGSTQMVQASSVMVNLLGRGNVAGRPNGLLQALALLGVHVHNYAKTTVRTGRKMGHVTVVHDRIQEAERLAQTAATLIQFGE